MSKKTKVSKVSKDYTLLKNAAILIFGEGVISLNFDEKEKVIEVVFKDFKLKSKKIDFNLRKILETNHDSLTKVLDEIRTKEVYGFETVLT